MCGLTVCGPTLLKVWPVLIVSKPLPNQLQEWPFMLCMHCVGFSNDNITTYRTLVNSVPLRLWIRNRNVQFVVSKNYSQFSSPFTVFLIDVSQR